MFWASDSGPNSAFCSIRSEIILYAAFCVEGSSNAPSRDRRMVVDTIVLRAASMSAAGTPSDPCPSSASIMRRSRVRTYVRQVEEALASGDKAAAQAAFKAAEPELMRAATKGVIHKNTASRKVSRLAQRLKVLSA